MKKIVFCLLLLISCTPDNRRAWVVTHIDKLLDYKDDYKDKPPSGCEYTLKTDIGESFEFNDDCNKFQIGDTLKLTKQ